MGVKTLVVQAHPSADCYNTALLEAALAGLRSKTDTVEVVRLCQGATVDPGSLATTEHLVVVYPTWWGAMPAVMLHWLQTSLGSYVDVGGAGSDRGDATQLRGGGEHMRSPLGSVRRLSVITSHGSSRRVNIVQGEPGLCLWRKTVLPLCAPGAVLHWEALYGIDRLAERRRRSFLDRVTKLFAAV